MAETKRHDATPMENERTESTSRDGGKTINDSVDPTEEEARLRMGGNRRDHTAEPMEPGNEQVGNGERGSRQGG